MQITRHQVQAFLKSQFKQGDIVVKLVLINLGVYLFLTTISFIEWVFRVPNDVISVFISKLFFLPNQAEAFLYKFYTLFTYQFIHNSFLHVFVNLLMLFFFGKLLLKHIGFKKLFPLYLFGGFFGGLLYVALSSSKLIPMLDTPMIGASASIMALMGATAFIMPDYILKFFFVFDVKLKWLVLVFGLLNVLSIFSLEGAGSGIIHLGGLVFGLLFMYLLQQGIDLAKPFNKALDYILALFNKRPKPRVTFVNDNVQKVKKKASKEVNQEKLDAILDKISVNGYESLSKEEKDYLFKASRQ